MLTKLPYVYYLPRAAVSTRASQGPRALWQGPREASSARASQGPRALGQGPRALGQGPREASSPRANQGTDIPAAVLQKSSLQ